MSVSKSVKLYASFRLNHPTMENLFPGLSRFSSAPESALKSNNLQDTANAASKTASTPTEEEWTEVVHAEGGVYYWNQRTGETTQLGEPKPEGSRSGNSSGSEQAPGGKESKENSNSSDPRTESPMPDRTGYYATMGALVGAGLGWASQFF